MKKLLALFMLGMVFFHANAQTGKYVVATSLEGIDCEQQKAYIDILIKATEGSSSFMLADQNYRFSFSRSTLVPGSVTLEKELDVSGVTDSGAGMGLFSAHNLNGTDDTIVSYNIELLGGNGYEITSDKWTSIGRLGFDMTNVSECFALKWHDLETFPPTHISELYGEGELHVMQEAQYQNLDVCLTDYCNITTSTDVVEEENFDMAVHPTVTKNTLRITYKGKTSASDTEVIIYSIAGNLVQKIQRPPNNKNEFSLNVVDLPQGIYVISMQVNEQWMTRKFVKM